jgi:putative acetyltransferase
MDGMDLRPERPGEERVVRDVVTRAFGDEHVGELVDALRASDAWLDLSFVAAMQDEVVAHVSLTRSLLDTPRELVGVLVLSPLSVVPQLQGRGIGSALTEHALEQVRRRPEPLVFLEGSAAYYRRFGFATGADLGFRRPSLRIPEEAFQVLRLPAYEHWMTGTLVYSHVFWDLDCVGLRS